MTFAFTDAAAFKARLPKFATVDDAVVTTALTEAQSWVGQSWISEAEFQLGQIYYAAHVLTLDGFGGGAEAAIANEGLSTFDQIQSGKLSVSRRQMGGSGDGASKSTLNLTIYGQRYLEVAVRNTSGPRLAQPT